MPRSPRGAAGSQHKAKLRDTESDMSGLKTIGGFFRVFDVAFFIPGFLILLAILISAVPMVRDQFNHACPSFSCIHRTSKEEAHKYDTLRSIQIISLIGITNATVPTTSSSEDDPKLKEKMQEAGWSTPTLAFLALLAVLLAYILGMLCQSISTFLTWIPWFLGRKLKLGKLMRKNGILRRMLDWLAGEDGTRDKIFSEPGMVLYFWNMGSTSYNLAIASMAIYFIRSQCCEQISIAPFLGVSALLFWLGFNFRGTSKRNRR